MKTFDDNWQALKDEDRTLPEKPQHSMIDAEDIKLVQWSNNPTNQKLTWRERMAPFVAWIDLGDHKGMWRQKENRLFEEIQYDYVTRHFGQGYRVVRSTARFEDGDAMLNAKTIHTFKENVLQEVFLILDGDRVFYSTKYSIKGGQGWKFKDSVQITKLIG